MSSAGVAIVVLWKWGVGSVEWGQFTNWHSLFPIPHSSLPISEIEQTQSRNLVDFAQPLRDEVADRLFVNFALHALFVTAQPVVTFFAQLPELLFTRVFPQPVEYHLFDHHQIHFERLGRGDARHLQV